MIKYVASVMTIEPQMCLCVVLSDELMNESCHLDGHSICHLNWLEIWSHKVG